MLDTILRGGRVIDAEEFCRGSGINAAFALRRPELGSFKPGCVGDATVLSVDAGTFDYVDVTGEHLAGRQRISSRGVVLNGKWWHPR